MIFICIFAGNVKPVQILRNDLNDILLPLDLDGFVAHVFSTKSKAGNEFFEVKFKIAEARRLLKFVIVEARIAEDLCDNTNYETSKSNYY